MQYPISPYFYRRYILGSYVLDGKCYNTRGRMQIPVFFAAKVEEEHRMLCSDLNNVFILEEHFAENPKHLLLNFEMIQT